MTKRLENIFNECLERMLQGESIESCLGSYPEEAAELEPLLRTTLGFRWRASSVQPSPEFKTQARLRFQEAQIQAVQQQSQPQKPGFFARQRSWALALTAVLVILLVGSGTAVASSDTLPDEFLYPTKLATEQVRLAFTFSGEAKVELHTQLAENRAQEIVAMAHQGKTEQVAIVTEKLADQLQETANAVAKVETTKDRAQLLMAPPAPAAAPSPPPSAEAYKTRVAEDAELEEANQAKTSVTAILENALENTPESARLALEQAIEISKKSYIKSP